VAAEGSQQCAGQVEVTESYLYLFGTLKDRLQPANSQWINPSLLSVGDPVGGVVSGEVEKLSGAREGVTAGLLSKSSSSLVAVPNPEIGTVGHSVMYSLPRSSDRSSILAVWSPVPPSGALPKESERSLGLTNWNGES
jgi:hypothetical protein